MATAPDIGRPPVLTVKYRVVKTNGAQQVGIPVLFLLECREDFFANPPAADRVRGEDHQKPIVAADGDIDSLARVVTAVQIGRRELAIHAGLLQRPVEALDKF